MSEPRSPLSHSPAEVKDVADNVPQNLKALIVLLYLTGLRIGEALALKWSDVDVEQSKFYVRRSVWRGKAQTPVWWIETNAPEPS